MPKHSEWREETGPHGAKRWVNLRTGRIQYRDPGTPHPTFARAQAEQKKKQSTDNSQGALGQHEEPNKAEVVDSAKLDQLIKTNKTPELFRGVPKMEHAEQFKTGDLRQGNGAYGPGIYVGYGYNGRETASKAAGDDGHMARMTLRPDAKVMTWDEAETTWEKEGKAEFSLDKYGGSEKAIAAFAKSKGVDVLDVQHNEFMNVLNPKALIVEKPKGTGEGGGNPPDDKPPEPPAPEAAWEEEALDAAWEKLSESEADDGNGKKSDSQGSRSDKRSKGASGTGAASDTATARADRSDKPADSGDKPADRGSGQVGADGTSGSVGDSVPEPEPKPSEDLTEEQKAAAKKKEKLAWNDIRNPQILNYLPPNG